MNEPFGNVDPIYIYVWLAFNAFMIYDAFRRKAPTYWYFIILFFPFGVFIYTFAVVLRNARFETESQKEPTEDPNSSPSIVPFFAANQVDLDQADRLEASEKYEEAVPFYRRALELSATNKRALHGLGRCFTGLGRAKEALDYYEKLLELDREYRDYSAALEYADALWESNQRNDCLELLERLADHTDRINHRLAFAHYLTEASDITRARQVIRQALENATLATHASDLKNRQWIERGEQMLAELDARDASAPS
jgi:tetratricopeptide (TPR) repeat protein